MAMQRAFLESGKEYIEVPVDCRLLKFKVPCGKGFWHLFCPFITEGWKLYFCGTIKLGVFS